MRVKTQWMPGTDTFGIWLMLDNPVKSIINIGRFTETGELRFDEIEEGTIVEPTLTLRSQAWAALRDALNGEDFTGGGSLNHLRDVTQVRDRLLKLVEGQLPPKLGAR